MYYVLKTLIYHSLFKIDFHQGWVNSSTTCISFESAVVAQCIKVVAPHAGSWAFDYQRQHTKLSKHIVTVTVPQLNVSNRCEYHGSSKTTIKKGCPVLLGHLCQVYVKFCNLLAGYGEVFIWIINNLFYCNLHSQFMDRIWTTVFLGRVCQWYVNIQIYFCGKMIPISKSIHSRYPTSVFQYFYFKKPNILSLLNNHQYTVWVTCMAFQGLHGWFETFVN